MIQNFRYILKDFIKLDNYFYKILSDKHATATTYCLSILQFIKPHTEYFVKYRYFIKNNFYFFFFISFFENIFRMIKWTVRKIEDFFLSLSNNKFHNLDQNKTDIIFVSCLVNLNTLGFRKNLNNDFVFGNIISDLRIKHNVKVFYINNTTLNSRNVFKELSHNKNIFILKKILSFSDEILILLIQFIEFKNLIFNFLIKKK